MSSENVIFCTLLCCSHVAVLPNRQQRKEKNRLHFFFFFKVNCLLLLLLNHFSRLGLCVTPQTSAHQALPPLGFSRQEHWSGLPFPSPMHESEKSKGSRSVVSNSQRLHGLQLTRLLHPWDFPGKSTGVGPGKSTGVGCHCLLRKLPNYPQMVIQ